MAHRFVNATKANWRFFSTLKSPARETGLELDRQLEELTSVINAVASMTPEEVRKKMVDMFGVTKDDMKALAPRPDENDPGKFEHEPRPDDDVRIHIQDGDSQCLLTNYLKRRLEHIPEFPRPVKMMGDKAYRISPTLHRGLGMFAVRQFKTGDLVTDERPLMVFPVGPLTDFDLTTAKVPGENRIRLTLKSSDDILSSIFERVSEESRDAFMGLQNSHLQNGTLFGTARTNEYGLEDDLKDETENIKLFSTLSSDNKMTELVCSPNIRRRFHVSTFSMQLRAARDIKEGEEIFTTYTDILEPAAVRAEGLVSYQITCTCRACLGLNKSDPIRAAVRKRPAIFVPIQKDFGESWIEPALETLSRIEQEELQDLQLYGRTLHQVFNAYVHMNNEEKALEFGKRLWAAKLTVGEDRDERFRNVELMKKSSQKLLKTSLLDLKLKAHLDKAVHCKSVRLKVPSGYHSFAMQPLLEEFGALSKRITVHAPKIPIISNPLGRVIREGDKSAFNAEYYLSHCADPVQFESGISALIDDASFTDIAAWIELGPHPTTLPMLTVHPGVSKEVLLVSSLKKRQDDGLTLLSSLSQLYTSNVPVRWRDVFVDVSAACVSLPSYPWQKSKFWVAWKEGAPAPASSTEGSTAPTKPFNPVNDFGMLQSWAQFPSAANSQVAIFETPISLLKTSITGHIVGDVPLCPASFYHELALAGIEASKAHLSLPLQGSHSALFNIDYVKPLVYSKDVAHVVKTTIAINIDGSGTFTVESYADQEPESVHCSGQFRPLLAVDTTTKFNRMAPVVSQRTAAISAGEDGEAEVITTRTAYEIIFTRVVGYAKEYHMMKNVTISKNGMEGSPATFWLSLRPSPAC
ncbi:hypothetical protein ARMGADRAFT_1088233 [Armillaria gallica]|uniref:Uncharacterized protein n=1 Tax=Armillaria gallica TaxID=47427 RepID=A0A2H3D6S8_ARMGA|nr:hypothetical protein ARMGADRAFT_1088233 [Armillaria gallica]